MVHRSIDHMCIIADFFSNLVLPVRVFLEFIDEFHIFVDGFNDVVLKNLVGVL